MNCWSSLIWMPHNKLKFLANDWDLFPFSTALILHSVVSVCVCLCEYVHVRQTYIYVPPVFFFFLPSHSNHSDSLLFPFQAPSLNYCQQPVCQCHHPVCLIYGLTQMSLVERNHVFIWCHWSFLSLAWPPACHFGGTYSMLGRRMCLRTPNPAAVAVSVSGTPVCSDRPATMMTASPPTRRRGSRANPDTPSKGAASRLHESASAPSKPHSASHPAGAEQPAALPLLPGPSKFHGAAPFGLDVVP